MKKDIVDHIAIVVKDIKDSIIFYTTKFQCLEIYSDSTWAILQFENIKLSLVKENEHPAHIAFIDDKVIYDSKSVTHRDGTISKYIKDKDGNSLELITYKCCKI